MSPSRWGSMRNIQIYWITRLDHWLVTVSAETERGFVIIRCLRKADTVVHVDRGALAHDENICDVSGSLESLGSVPQALGSSRELMRTTVQYEGNFFSVSHSVYTYQKRLFAWRAEGSVAFFRESVHSSFRGSGYKFRTVSVLKFQLSTQNRDTKPKWSIFPWGITIGGANIVCTLSITFFIVLPKLLFLQIRLSWVSHETAYHGLGVRNKVSVIFDTLQP